LFEFLFSSFFIIFLLLFIYYLVNKYNFINPNLRKGSLIKLEDFRPIDRDKGLILISVYEKKLLIGYDKQRMYVLKEWEGK